MWPRHGSDGQLCRQRSCRSPRILPLRLAMATSSPEPDSCGGSGGADQHVKVQRKEQSQMLARWTPRATMSVRPSRPTCFTGDMAVQWKACGGEATRQSTWRLGQLRSLCPPPVVPAKEGISFQPHRGQQCGDGSEGP